MKIKFLIYFWITKCSKTDFRSAQFHLFFVAFARRWERIDDGTEIDALERHHVLRHEWRKKRVACRQSFLQKHVEKFHRWNDFNASSWALNGKICEAKTAKWKASTTCINREKKNRSKKIVAIATKRIWWQKFSVEYNMWKIVNDVCLWTLKCLTAWNVSDYQWDSIQNVIIRLSHRFTHFCEL